MFAYGFRLMGGWEPAPAYRELIAAAEAGEQARERAPVVRRRRRHSIHPRHHPVREQMQVLT